MNADLLWNGHPLKTWLVSFGLLIISILGLRFINIRAQNIAPYMLIIVSLLIFVFFTRLPSGRWHIRLAKESVYAVGSALLFACGLAWIVGLGIPSVFIADEFMRYYIPLAVFSHLAVRIFARPFETWKKMRRRRLIWAITHAQLRLVLVTMVLVFAVISWLMLGNSSGSFAPSDSGDLFANTLTLLISLAGFFGIITGFLLPIVIIPAAVISYLTAQRLTRRVENLITTTRQVRGRHNRTRVAVEGEDEIAQLQTDFNQMLDRLDSAQHALENERDTVRQLLENRRRLFADVSHELRTPITTIRSYLEGITPDATNSAEIGIISREVLRLQHLIDDVFALARADIDQLQYDVKPLEISAVLERVAATMRQQAWQARKIDVILDYRPQLPLVCADETRIEQCLYNLLRNAVRHTPPGGLIRIAAHAAAQTVSIDVQDTGSGIHPDDLPHIWQRFYRAADTRASDPAGSGLGLALVKEMVEAMGGAVSVTSTPQQGSCFTLTLPRA